MVQLTEVVWVSMACVEARDCSFQFTPEYQCLFIAIDYYPGVSLEVIVALLDSTKICYILDCFYLSVHVPVSSV